MASQLRFTTSIAAGATFDPLTNWQYRYAPRAGVFSVLLHHRIGAAVDPASLVLATITSGSDTLSEESPIQQTITANASLLPRPDDTVPVTDQVDGGDLLKITLRNTGAGAALVAGIIEFA